MGTNYYVEDEPTCNNPAHNTTTHIGKSSGGWVFGFHGIPDRGLTSWAAWRAYLDGKTITDEYGRTLTLAQFQAVVTERYAPTSRTAPLSRLDPTVRNDRSIWGPYGSAPDPEREWTDDEGHDFTVGEFS